MADVCKHGSLRRVCPICLRDDEIKDLQAENKRLTANVSQIHTLLEESRGIRRQLQAELKRLREEKRLYSEAIKRLCAKLPPRIPWCKNQIEATEDVGKTSWSCISHLLDGRVLQCHNASIEEALGRTYVCDIEPIEAVEAAKEE